MPSQPVLIVGAGPTGLVLALWLACRGIPFRIIDKNSGPGQASRAMVVQARILEFYQQLGIAHEVVANGIKMERMHVRKKGKSFAILDLNDIGAGISPYPYVLCYPQDDHERFLVAKLKSLGVEVEWGVELKELSQKETRICAVLEKAGTEEVCQPTYVCGCDGAHSTVRRQLKIDFPGGTYSNLFYVADVKIEGGFQVDAFMNLGTGGFALMFPVRSSGMQRLIGLVPQALSGRNDLTFEDIRPDAEQLLHVHVDQVNWFATYHVHHRVAEHFQVGRCFLAGDAGHIHSPAGGQGMNTGIGDAVNLAWKLASVIQSQASSSSLDTYETERIAFARTLVASTDKAFQAITGRGFTGRFFRMLLIPSLMPILLSFKAVRRLMFKTVSQVRINYRQSALSAGKAGEVFGGDRLPWIPSDQGDDFTPLQSLDWQLHLYGTARPDFVQAATALKLSVKEFPWSEATHQAGLKRDAAYLVRPDGYVALALAEQDPVALRDYVTRLGLKFGGHHFDFPNNS